MQRPGQPFTARIEMLSKVCDILHHLWRLRFLEWKIRSQPTTSEHRGDTLIGINRCIEARLHLGC